MEKRRKSYFEKAKREAEQFENEPGKLKELVQTAKEKASKHKGGLSKVWAELQGALRLLNAWRKGEYKRAPWKSMALLIAAVIYFVNPFDAIMDFIPIIGFGDDAAILLLVMNSVRKDVVAFLEWEEEQKSVETVDIEAEVS